MNNAILELLKIDLGITHNLRDAYFMSALESAKEEMEGFGIVFDLDRSDDQMLIADYTAYTYRNRQNNVPLSRSIQFRINNRVIKKAGTSNAIN
ncbi:hypothetical protein [Niallia sp. RD1]|uniref:hypothetical protein n=1 Tax=Niallia sp. RD1 TaxID=2962858 RepID=UPI0020C1955C|nr:hypothetical protein [Niallia sp. RD1]UTI42105.1 hypothetical protein NKG37_25390 [Niallia sp. RD1]